ncbi:MAG: hypothetical protein EOM83_08130 [Clostridia bacterium]|nr:hypothetical protein [Clostridia bacterium]
MNLNVLKLLPAIALFLVAGLQAKGQDLLVTNQGDSISCQIVKMENERIYYLLPGQEPPPATILMNNVAAYYYNYYNQSVAGVTLVTPGMLLPRWRVGAGIGWSQRTAPIAEGIPSQLKEYMRDLKSGLCYTADVSYFFSEKVGMGVKYNQHYSKAEIVSSYQRMSDEIRIHYVGPFLTARLYGKRQKNSLVVNLALGYTSYKDAGTFNNEAITITGQTAAFSYDVIYDIQLTKNLMLGLQLSLTAGALSQYEETINGHTETIQLPDGEYEGLGRVDFIAGLRYVY